MKKGKATHSSILAWRIPWTYSPRQSVFNEILTGAANAGCSQEDLELFKASIADSANLKYSQELTKKLEVQEEQLDLQQQKIQTELSVAQSQLEAVQQAEGQAIKNATPKYNGVG